MGTLFVQYNKVVAPPTDAFLSYVSAYYPLTVDGSNARGIVSPLTTATPLTFYNGAAINNTHTLNGYNTLRLNQSTQAYADIVTSAGYGVTEDGNRAKLFDITQTTQWTIECYAYFDSLNGGTVDSELFGDYANIGISPYTPYGFAFFVRSPSSGVGNLGLYDPAVGGGGGTAVIATSNAISTAQWYHLSCERNGTTLRGYVNGSKVFESTSWTNGNSSVGVSGAGDDAFNPSGFTVGALAGPGSAYRSGSSPLFTGAIAGIRITKGVNRYGCPSTSFTPDTFPFPTI